MRSLIRFGLSQSVLMNLVFIATVFFAALWALPRLPVDRYPNFSFGEQTITVQWPGASAADVERLVAKEIEDAIRGMDGFEMDGKHLAVVMAMNKRPEIRRGG